MIYIALITLILIGAVVGQYLFGRDGLHILAGRHRKRILDELQHVPQELRPDIQDIPAAV